MYLIEGATDWKFCLYNMSWFTGASNESLVGVGGNSAGGQIAAMVCHYVEGIDYQVFTDWLFRFVMSRCDEREHGGGGWRQCRGPPGRDGLSRLAWNWLPGNNGGTFLFLCFRGCQPQYGGGRWGWWG